MREVRIIMDSIKESIQYNRIVRTCGNKYAAIQAISNKAHDNIASCNGELSASKCITWALYGEKPKYESKRDTYIKEYIYQVLCNIDDVDIRDAVDRSMSDSLVKKHLVYNYDSISDAYKQSRIRVICRMIWYSLYPEKYGGNDGRRSNDEY